MAAKKRPARKTMATKKEAAAKGEGKTAKKPWALPGWETLAIAGGVAAILAVNTGLGLVGEEWSARLASFLGIAFLLGLALLMSADRRRIPLRTVLVGLGLQLAIGLLALRTPVGTYVFRGAGKVFDVIFASSGEGARFVFGPLARLLPVPPFEEGGNAVMAFLALPIIIFMGALSRILYHVGILQWVVRGLAWVMRRLMRASGAESLSAGANIFVGMVEAPLTIRPYVAGLTRSELFCVMTAGMATVAGSVMAVYVSMIRGFVPHAAGHLLTASVMSAPAAILIAKIIFPETGAPATLDAAVLPAMDEGDSKPVNVMDAAARGSLEGLKVALNVAGMLIAFIALVAMANVILGAVSGGHLTFQRLAGWILSPVALGMGIPWDEAARAGGLIGEKTVLNEWVAYTSFGGMMADKVTAFSGHTALVMSYALCGFANFGSVAIMIAGVGGIAPNQRPNLARLGLLSIVSGSLAAFMTGCWAGVLG
jgi:CNT family concentrative nucleoside transporter